MSYEKIKRVMKNTPEPDSDIDWESRKNVVMKFKKRYKRFLRIAQKGVCCYCLRPLGDDGDVDLEHIIEKDIAPTIKFKMKNLALACGRCNGNKEAWRKILHTARVKTIKAKFTNLGSATIEMSVASWIDGDYASHLDLQDQAYRMYHPHFHVYSDHIEYRSNLIYVYKTLLGENTIKSLKLSDLSELERRRIKERGGDYAVLSYNLANINMQNLSREEGLEIIRQLQARLA